VAQTSTQAETITKDDERNTENWMKGIYGAMAEKEVEGWKQKNGYWEPEGQNDVKSIMVYIISRKTGTLCSIPWNIS
jgi:hypothetical protein